MSNTPVSLGELPTQSSMPAGGAVLVRQPRAGDPTLFDIGAVAPGAIASAPAPGQGFTFRGAWLANTAYAPYDVLTYGGQTFVVTATITSPSSFGTSGLALMAAAGQPGPTGAQGPAGPAGAAGASSPATATTIGGVRPGSGLAVAPDGTLSVTTSYTLPAATASALGGVKQGAGLTIAGDGTISAAVSSAVTTLNGRSGVVTLTLGDVTNVVGTGATARSNLGLAVVAATGGYADLVGAPSVPAPSSAAPAADGIANPGSSAAYARADHVHPADTSRLAAASNLSDVASAAAARGNLGLAAVAASGAYGDLAGAPAIPAASSAAPLADGVASAGSSGSFARSDHTHPSDASRLAVANNLSDLASPATARTNLGLGGAATLGVGTAAGTVAAGNDGRLVAALQPAAIPAAAGQLLGGSGSAGAAVAVSLGSGLALSGGTLSLTTSYTLPAASATVLGGVKQGSGVSIAADGTISATVSSGVTTFNSRSGAVTLSLADVTGVLGTGSGARSSLALAAVAASGAYSDLSGAPAIPAPASTAPAADGVAASGSSSAYARADHVHPTDATRLGAAANLGDVANAAAARANLGLGGAATLSVGTTPGTVAAGDDSRLASALQPGAIPAAAGQLLGGSGSGGAAAVVSIGAGLALSSGSLSVTASYTLPAASATVLGGVKQGSGVTIAGDGTISATASTGVASFNTRSGAVTLALSDVTGVTGTGASARTNLGLAAVAASGAYSDLSGAPAVPTPSATVPAADGTASAGSSALYARADHVHPTDTSRLGASAIPAAAGQVLGGSGTQGAAAAISIGAGLTLAGGTLSATGSTSPATTSSLGTVKVGAGLAVAGDGTLSAAVLPVSGIVIDGTTIAATPSTPYQMGTADRVVVLNKTSGAASQVTLPASPLLWVEYVVIDGRGDAGTNTITIAAPSSATIDGQANFVANANGDRISLRASNATTWFTT